MVDDETQVFPPSNFRFRRMRSLRTRRAHWGSGSRRFDKR